MESLVRRREVSDTDGESGSSTLTQIDDNSKSRSTIERFLVRELSKLENQSTIVRKAMNGIRRLPPSVRIGLVALWLLWKLVVALIMIRLAFSSTFDTSSADSGPLASSFIRDLKDMEKTNNSNDNNTKILYIVTALAEYNNGERSTIKGQDRFAEVLTPVLIDSVEALIAPPYNYDVDVYLILGYELKPERHQMIMERLPPGVGLQVWNDAIPLGYDVRKAGTLDYVVPNTRALARQHRYVIRDKFHHYDLFLALEDDMRFTGAHVKAYLEVTAKLDDLIKEAPENTPDVPESQDPKQMRFFGPMTKNQLKRVVPGFVRVEILLNETRRSTHSTLDAIPLDFDYNGEKHIDPSTCCHIPNMHSILDTPTLPSAQDVVIWETAVKGLSVRQLPNSEEWVILLPGPGKKLSPQEYIGGYWSGRDGDYGNIKKPGGGQPDLVAQQGGWLATRGQIFRLDEELCMGNFLPPFDFPKYVDDGQKSMNVEFWSGGYQLFTGVRNGCNMQRIMRFDPEDFSKQLIYHVANNKQKQLHSQRMLSADHLLAQLNTVRKRAIKLKAEVAASSPEKQ